jgi:signal transduction histidine kinase
MELADLRPLVLFDGVTDDQLRTLIESSDEVAFEAGVDLWQAGDPADHWWVLIEGTVDLVRRVGREDSVVGRFDAPGRWAGGFRAWDADGVYLATARTTGSGRMLRVPAEALRDLMTSFPLVSHFLGGLLHTARNIEAGARQREALVTLGTLSAGLAHEINNPAAAASRAVDSLTGEMDGLLSSLSRLAAGGISAGQFSELDELRREIEPERRVRDAMAVADHEEVLAEWMRRRDVEREWAIAPALAAAGVDLEWCERAAKVLDGPALEPGLEWVASTLSAAALLAEVKESTRRVSDLIGAVKSYSQMDRGSKQVIDVTEGIESTLVMLGQQLRGGVTVVREYAADVPRIEAYAGELNQVWTNLIDNAVDAMDGVGTLRITTTREGDGVAVVVTDTGAGMRPEVAARAFEPFFTTKAVGKGTGLGLDIARRIVTERHGGAISVDSRPGETAFRVRLPVRQPSH